jgi:hypothetical protein
MKKQRVIDADNMRTLEVFDSKDTDTVLNRYRAMSRWDEVDVDVDGDIILFKDE